MYITAYINVLIVVRKCPGLLFCHQPHLARLSKSFIIAPMYAGRRQEQSEVIHGQGEKDAAGKMNRHDGRSFVSRLGRQC